MKIPLEVLNMKDQFADLISKLSSKQLSIISETIKILLIPFKEKRLCYKDNIFTDEIIDSMGDFLKIHHCFSKEPFSKDKFEYALERTFNICGIEAQLAPKGNRGHDITINKTKISLKTQADSNIKENEIHISKFMELGKGEWILNDLRKQFLLHMEKYELIYSLRCLSSDDERSSGNWHYELINIPKILLQEAKNGSLRIMEKSKQDPKPGYCDIFDPSGKDIKFQLYFDGGSERKLQIKHLQKKHCYLIATWKFSINK
jgi:type II restriction enzyme